MYNLKDSRVLVTGGAGFVGSHLVDQLLLEDPAEIVILDNLLRGSEKNLTTSIHSPKVKLYVGDIRDIKLLDKLMQGIDYCFHLAAIRITRCNESPSEAFEIMMKGTFNIMEACRKYKIKKIVYSSTASVYGTADFFPTNETHHPYNNHTFYGAAKTSGELMLRAYHEMYHLPFCALRYFNLYGERMDNEGKYTEVLIRWYKLIKQGQAPKIFGDGKQTMDFVYVTDVAKANILAMQSEVKDNIYNIGTGRETSLSSLANLLINAMEKNLFPQHLPLPEERKKVEVARRLADINLAKKEINFLATVSLETGLKKLITWLDTTHIHQVNHV